MRNRLLLAPLAIAACALAVGCGGSSSDDPSSSDAGDQATPPSLAEYVDQADHVCEELGERVDPQKAQLASDLGLIGSKDDATKAAGAMRELADLMDESLVQLRELALPTESRGTLEEMMSLHQTQIHLFRTLSSAVVRDDVAEVKELEDRLIGNENRYDQITRKIGFERC